MSPSEQRAAVVAEALTWLGTPWRHAARLKGVGVDCANLVIAVYAACGLIPAFDPPPYPRDWHIHKSEEWFLRLMPGFPAREIAEVAAGPGDLILFRMGRVYSHAAIVIEPGRTGVHAAVNEGQVVRCNLDRDVGLTSGPRKFFTFEGWLSAPSGGGDSPPRERVGVHGGLAGAGDPLSCVATGEQRGR